MDFILSFISIPKIMELPIVLSASGGILIALFLIRAIRSVFSLRLITVFTSLVYAAVVAIILSQGGQAIAQLMGLEEQKPAEESSLYPSKLPKPTYPTDFQYTS